MAAPLPVSSKDLIRFTPDGYESESEKPVYLIGVPTLVSKPRWQRDVAAAGAAPVSADRTMEFLRDAVNALLVGDAKAEALADFDRLAEFQERQKTVESGGQPLSNDEAVELGKIMLRISELGEWAGRNWPPYSEITAQQEYWWTMARALAAKHFLRGWDGVTEPCATCEGSGVIKNGGEPPETPCARCEAAGRVPLKFRSRDGFVLDELLEKLPRGDVLAAGFKAISLMRLDWERKKN